ncbi:hypothetical protein [Aeromonas caviae]|uniref:hypothetical protein n=1 Tax=Aeromonas caviae TaxID=648 RepID=UPI002B495480|nr:hypothetical protein [Aeromonas caviae]
MNRINIKLTLMMLAAYVGASFFSYAAESGSEIEKEMCAKLPEVIKKVMNHTRQGNMPKQEIILLSKYH